MGVATRDYMQRPIEPDDGDSLDVPTWETMADALRVRLMGAIERLPINSVQEAAALAEALNTLQMCHARGKVYDREDEQRADADE